MHRLAAIAAAGLIGFAGAHHYGRRHNDRLPSVHAGHVHYSFKSPRLALGKVRTSFGAHHGRGR